MFFFAFVWEFHGNLMLRVKFILLSVLYWWHISSLWWLHPAGLFMHSNVISHFKVNPPSIIINPDPSWNTHIVKSPLNHTWLGWRACWKSFLKNNFFITTYEMDPGKNLRWIQISAFLPFKWLSDVSPVCESSLILDLVAAHLSVMKLQCGAVIMQSIFYKILTVDIMYIYIYMLM